MVGTTDIPDWCYFEAYGSEGKNSFTEAPSAEDLALFHSKSPTSHISKVKTPTLFLLGAQDIRLPICIGSQYAQAMKEKGVPVKVIVFPNDTHAIERYVPLSPCLSHLPGKSWHVAWPERLSSKPPSLSPEPRSEDQFYKIGRGGM